MRQSQSVKGNLQPKGCRLRAGLTQTGSSWPARSPRWHSALHRRPCGPLGVVGERARQAAGAVKYSVPLKYLVWGY